MRRTLYAIGVLLFAACAPRTEAIGPKQGPCGGSAPVQVIVDSNQFADVVIRDAGGRRLGLATGHSLTRFRFCAYSGMPARFILDPVGGGMGYVLDGGMGPTPGSTVLLTLGSELRISFAAVIPPQ